MEYLGYTPGERLDLSSSLGGLIDKIGEIDEDRAKKRAEYDKANQENIDKIGIIDDYKTPSLQEFVHAGADIGRQNLMKWHQQLKRGEISASDWRNRQNNLMQNWSQLAASAKTFDLRIQEAQQRQQPGKDGIPDGSSFDLWLAGEYAEYGDLRNKTLYVDDASGNVYIAGVNPENGQIDNSSIMPISAINNPGNIVDMRVKLNNVVQEYMKGIPDWKIETGNKTVTEKNKYIATIKANLAKAIATNSRTKASVLTDNTAKGYRFVKNMDEYNAGMADLLATEEQARKIQFGDNYKPMTEEEQKKFVDEHHDLFIAVNKDANGIWQPVLNENQEKAVNDAIYQTIDAYMTKEISYDEPQSNNNSRKNDGGSGKNSNELLAGYKATLRAWGYDPNSVIANKDDESKWKVVGSNFSGLKAGYKYEKAIGEDGKSTVVKVYKISDGKAKGTPDFIATKPKDLAQYVYNGSASEVSVDWENARHQATVSPEKKAAPNKKYTEAQEANIKATMKAYPNATREQVIKALNY